MAAKTQKQNDSRKLGSGRRADEFFARHGAEARDLAASGEYRSLDDARRYDNFSHMKGVECDCPNEQRELTAEEIASHEAKCRADFEAREAAGDLPF